LSTNGEIRMERQARLYRDQMGEDALYRQTRRVATKVRLRCTCPMRRVQPDTPSAFHKFFCPMYLPDKR